MRILTLLLSLVMLHGCSYIPDKLEVPESTQLVAYLDVKKQADHYSGQTVRWGGEIANVMNLKDSTMIEVVNLHLNASTKPKQNNESQGRFRLYYKGLLDPLIYTQGKKITAVGTVIGVEEGKIGELEYLFPVIETQNVHIWKKIKKINMYYDPLYSHSYWGNYYFRHPARMPLRGPVKRPAR